MHAPTQTNNTTFLLNNNNGGTNQHPLQFNNNIFQNISTQSGLFVSICYHLLSSLGLYIGTSNISDINKTHLKISNLTNNNATPVINNINNFQNINNITAPLISFPTNKQPILPSINIYLF